MLEMKLARVVSLAVVAASTMLAFPMTARADAQAEEYFQQGKAAMGRHEYVKACSLFEASKALEDTLGTLLNLADCHQQAGKVATAWGEFSDAEQRARSSKPPREERAVFAHDRAEALRKLLPRLKIIVPVAVRVEGLVISIDGHAVPPEAWENGVPVDPGLRKVSAAAPGKKPWSMDTRIDPVEGESLIFPIQVEPLKDAPKVVAAPPPKTGVSDATEIEAVATSRARRTAGYIVGGIGLAGLTIGGVMTGFLVSAINEEKKACRDGTCFGDGLAGDTAPQAREQRSNAITDLNVAAVSGGVGLAALSVGIYLIVTSSPKVAPKTAIAPSIGPGHQGLSVIGQF